MKLLGLIGKVFLVSVGAATVATITAGYMGVKLLKEKMTKDYEIHISIR